MTHPFLRLHTDDELEQARARSEEAPVVLFKHSALCSLSAMARQEMLQLTKPGDPPVYQLVVQESRPLSNTIESTYGIRHESPQVIVLYRGEPVFNASHRRVTAAAIRDVVAGVKEAA